MKILFIGDSKPDSTSRHRANALQRLGHTVKLFDPYQAAGRAMSNRYLYYLHFRTGFRLLQPRMSSWLKTLNFGGEAADVIWVNGGEFFGPSCLQWLRQFHARTILYNNDDPTGTRDGRRFDSLCQSIKHYDLCVVPRAVNVPEYQALGAKQVTRVMMSYDEIVHAPESLSPDLLKKYASDVCFIGTWMPERGPFLARLLELGVPLSIWGDRWPKATEWKQLKTAWRGDTLNAHLYKHGLAASKIAIGLLSKGNRDLHTRRSLEIPFIGGLLCAERTTEHQMLYEDGKEAVFWNDADECARRCHELLANPDLRESIRLAGQRRVKELKLGNEDICRQILAELK